MSDAPPPSGDQPKVPTPGEIPLEDIDALLMSEDPEFSKSLDEVRAVVPDASVTIVAAAIDQGEDGEGGELNPELLTGFAKIKAKFRIWRRSFRQKMADLAKRGLKNLIVFLKTKPKEYLLFTIAMGKVGAKNIMVPVRVFQNASALQRMAGLFLVLVVLGSLWVLLANFKGVWIPRIHEPILDNFENYATGVQDFDPKDPGESFYSAFPQERHEFLFPKMKVNLRRTAENPLPMGAFEIIVQLDSKDTAIEVRDREVEFSDLLQRTLEEETFNDLTSEMGKGRLKSSIKRELNQKLTQGWIKDVNFQTFILKP